MADDQLLALLKLGALLQAVQDGGDDEDKWVCGHCDTKNDKSTNECKSCGALQLDEATNSASETGRPEHLQIPEVNNRSKSVPTTPKPEPTPILNPDAFKPDRKKQKCTSCEREFGYFFRTRALCVGCGLTFCHGCLVAKRKVHMFGPIPQPVCGSCAMKVKGRNQIIPTWIPGSSPFQSPKSQRSIVDDSPPVKAGERILVASRGSAKCFLDSIVVGVKQVTVTTWELSVRSPKTAHKTKVLYYPPKDNEYILPPRNPIVPYVGARCYTTWLDDKCGGRYAWYPGKITSFKVSNKEPLQGRARAEFDDGTSLVFDYPCPFMDDVTFKRLKESNDRATQDDTIQKTPCLIIPNNWLDCRSEERKNPRRHIGKRILCAENGRWYEGRILDIKDMGGTFQIRAKSPLTGSSQKERTFKYAVQSTEYFIPPPPKTHRMCVGAKVIGTYINNDGGKRDWSWYFGEVIEWDGGTAKVKYSDGSTWSTIYPPDDDIVNIAKSEQRLTVGVIDILCRTNKEPTIVLDPHKPIPVAPASGSVEGLEAKLQTKLLQLLRSSSDDTKCEHTLTLQGPKDGMTCDICKKNISTAEKFYGCREHNYDECKTCHERKISSYFEVKSGDPSAVFFNESDGKYFYQFMKRGRPVYMTNDKKSLYFKGDRWRLSTKGDVEGGWLFSKPSRALIPPQGEYGTENSPLDKFKAIAQLACPSPCPKVTWFSKDGKIIPAMDTDEGTSGSSSGGALGLLRALLNSEDKPNPKLQALKVHRTINISGAGNREVNGLYVLHSKPFNDAPCWKLRHSNKEYTVCRAGGTASKAMKWWICRTDRNGIESDIDFYTVKSEAEDEPPVVGWEVLKGIPPVPKVELKGHLISAAPSAECDHEYAYDKADTALACFLCSEVVPKGDEICVCPSCGIVECVRCYESKISSYYIVKGGGTIEHKMLHEQDGEYHYDRMFSGRPLYKTNDGTNKIMYSTGGVWRLSLDNNTKGWLFCVDSEHTMPPAGRWTTKGSPLDKHVQVARDANKGQDPLPYVRRYTKALNIDRKKRPETEKGELGHPEPAVDTNPEDGQTNGSSGEKKHAKNQSESLDPRPKSAGGKEGEGKEEDHKKNKPPPRSKRDDAFAIEAEPHPSAVPEAKVHPPMKFGGVLHFHELDVKKSRKLGEGSFAEAHLATIVSLDRKVVLKEPFRARGLDRETLDEVASLSQLKKHPNLLEFVGVVTLQEIKVCFITKYCELGSVDKLHRTFDLNYAEDEKYRGFLSLALDICSGLHFLHQQGIIHRDLACRNLLMKRDHTVVISDYGLSRKVDHSRGYYRMTKSSTFAWPWTSPEALSTGKFDKVSDIWAMGVTFWEITAKGAKPYSKYIYQCSLMEEVQEGIATGEFILKVPKSATELARKMTRLALTFEPAKRPSTGTILEYLRAEAAKMSDRGKKYKPFNSSTSRPNMYVYNAQETL